MDSFVKIVFFLKATIANVEAFVSNLYKSILSLIKVIFLSRFGIQFPRALVENSYVLGNGPSLKLALERHEELFKESELFCVNTFPTTEEYEKLKPKNLVFLDGSFFVKPDERMKIVSDTINSLLEKTTWKLNLFIPTLTKNSKQLIKELSTNSQINICYFNYTIVDGFQGLNHYLFRKNLGMPLCQNVLGVTIFLSLNMGYKNTYIFGADHTYASDLIVGEDNELYIKFKHFYTKEDMSKSLTRLKHPGTEKKMSMTYYLSALVKVFTTYFVLQEYSKQKNAKIFNATEGSYIDAFERVKL